MSKRTHLQIRIAILENLHDEEFHSYSNLERRARTNWQTVRQHCTEMEAYGFVIFKDQQIRITEKGKTALQKLKAGKL